MYGIIAGLLAFVIVAITMIYCCCFRRAQPTSQPFFQARIMSQRHNLRRKLLFYLFIYYETHKNTHDNEKNK